MPSVRKNIKRFNPVLDGDGAHQVLLVSANVLLKTGRLLYNYFGCKLKTRLIYSCLIILSADRQWETALGHHQSNCSLKLPIWNLPLSLALTSGLRGRTSFKVITRNTHCLLTVLWHPSNLKNSLNMYETMHTDYWYIEVACVNWLYSGGSIEWSLETKLAFAVLVFCLRGGEQHKDLMLLWPSVLIIIYI